MADAVALETYLKDRILAEWSQVNSLSTFTEAGSPGKIHHLPADCCAAVLDTTGHLFGMHRDLCRLADGLSKTEAFAANLSALGHLWYAAGARLEMRQSALELAKSHGGRVQTWGGATAPTFTEIVFRIISHHTSIPDGLPDRWLLDHAKGCIRDSVLFSPESHMRHQELQQYREWLSENPQWDFRTQVVPESRRTPPAKNGPNYTALLAAAILAQAERLGGIERVLGWKLSDAEGIRTKCGYPIKRSSCNKALKRAQEHARKRLDSIE